MSEAHYMFSHPFFHFNSCIWSTHLSPGIVSPPSSNSNGRQIGKCTLRTQSDKKNRRGYLVQCSWSTEDVASKRGWGCPAKLHLRDFTYGDT